MTEPDWHLVLSRDGTVLAVGRPMAAHWVGARLDDCSDAPLELREAARALLVEIRQSREPVSARAVFLGPAPSTVEVIVIGAIPLRRLPVFVRTMLGSTVDMMLPQARAADIALKSVVDADVPATMSLDGDKVAWAIVSLIGSALRHVHSGSRFQVGGSISLWTTYDPVASEVTIEVKDNGCGIAAEKVPLLLGRDPDRPRLGLTLMLVQDVVAAHGGRVEIDSSTEPFERGTAIRLTLPVS